MKHAPPRRTSPSKQPTPLVLGIDVGGGKLLAELFEVKNKRLSKKPFWSAKETSEKGINEHVQQISKLIEEAQAYSIEKQQPIVAVGIGCPGRFRKDGSIMPGTSPFMGKNPNDGAFDNQNLEQLYREALGEEHPLAGHLTVNNDGNAMLAGYIDLIRNQQDSEEPLVDQNGALLRADDLKEKHVALLGIGTGVGHAIAKFDLLGRHQFVTDGHASKLRVKVDDEDWEFMKFLNSYPPEPVVKIFEEDQTARAEDLFRLYPILTMSGAERRGNLDPAVESHRIALKIAGKYMARTIALIHSGKNQDVVPENGWSEEDKQEAAQTSIYLIGGGLPKEAAKTFIAAAGKELKRLQLDDIQLVKMPELNIAARAAALMVPPENYRSLSTQGKNTR